MYSRTQNENGSINTRCLDCFMTVAFCLESEAELERVEANHLCPEKVFAEMTMKERAAEMRAAGH